MIYGADNMFNQANDLASVFMSFIHVHVQGVSENMQQLLTSTKIRIRKLGTY